MTRGIPGLMAYPKGRIFARGDALVQMPPQAFTLIFTLCANAPNIFTHDELFGVLWGEPEDGGPLGPRGVVRGRICKVRHLTALLGVRICPAWRVGYSAIDLLAQSVDAPKPASSDPVPYAITYHLKPVALQPRVRTFRRPQHEGRNGCDSRLEEKVHQVVAT